MQQGEPLHVLYKVVACTRASHVSTCAHEQDCEGHSVRLAPPDVWCTRRSPTAGSVPVTFRMVVMNMRWNVPTVLGHAFKHA